MLAPWKKSYDKPIQCIKKQRHYYANKGLYSQSYGFSNSHVWMSELDQKESWAPKNWCFWTVVLEKTLENPLDSKEIQISLDSKEIQPVYLKEISPDIYWKDWCWSWTFNTLATIQMPTHWKRPWCWQRVKAGGKGDDRGWDGWMASPTQWTWIWASSRRCWRTGKPAVLQSKGLQSQIWLSNWTTSLAAQWNKKVGGNIRCLLKLLLRAINK